MEKLLDVRGLYFRDTVRRQPHTRTERREEVHEDNCTDTEVDNLSDISVWIRCVGLLGVRWDDRQHPGVDVGVCKL